MKILIISDSFLPEKISAAKHMSDIVKKLVNLGHQCSILATQKEIDIGINKLKVNIFSVHNPFKRSKKMYVRGFFEILFPIFLGNLYLKSFLYLSESLWIKM